MKYCAEQGCTTLIAKGRYCPDHRRRSKRKNNYKHDNKSLYNSAVWKRLTSFIYEDREGKCERCGKFVFGKDAHNHHVIPVKQAPELRLSPDNIKLLCSSCHVVEEKVSQECKIPSYFK